MQGTSGSDPNGGVQVVELISAASDSPYIFASMSGMLDLSRDEKATDWA